MVLSTTTASWVMEPWVVATADDMATYNGAADDGIPDDNVSDNGVTEHGVADNDAAMFSLPTTSVSQVIGTRMMGTADDMATYDGVADNGVADDKVVDNILPCHCCQ